VSSHDASDGRRASGRTRTVLRTLLACSLGVGAALLVACGSSNKSLIPAASAGPLTEDVEAVEAAAKNGNCGDTNTKLGKLEGDFVALPSTVNRGLRNTLRQGITNLRKVASELCAQRLVNTNTNTTQTKTETTPAPTTKTETSTTQTTPTTPPSEEEEEPGGTPAPGEGNGGPGGEGDGNGTPGGQEAGK